MKHQIRLVALFVIAAFNLVVNAQHGHLNAGAVGTNLLDKLYFVNGALFAAESGYVRPLTFMTSGTYSNYYAGNISMVALPATIENGGPAFNAPALGTFIVAEITSVEGPAGGMFGFWEAGAKTPTYSVPTGTTNGNRRFELSDISAGAGLPEADPYGHIHGRQFTATTPGIYKVGFTLYDTADYYPVHSPSDTFYINFAAGTLITGTRLTNGAFSFLIPASASTNLMIEASTNLTTNAWVHVAGPFIGLTNSMTFVDTNAPLTGARFYRIVE